MNTLHLQLQRKKFNDKNVIGELFANLNFFSYTLEDVVRAGEKVYGETAIPAGDYIVELTYSNRFKRMMPLVYNIPKDKSVQRDGKKFEGIRMHDGKTDKHTEGCILVGENTDGISISEGATNELISLLLQHFGWAYLTIEETPGELNKTIA